jgi:hypothetical protein
MILHRQGTQPRLIDSSEHSSINLNLRKRNSGKTKDKKEANLALLQSVLCPTHPPGLNSFPSRF